MKQNVTKNENMEKLRQITEDMCSHKKNYESIVAEVKSVIDETSTTITGATSPEKIKCYETMCQKIKNILNVK